MRRANADIRKPSTNESSGCKHHMRGCSLHDDGGRVLRRRQFNVARRDEFGSGSGITVESTPILGVQGDGGTL